MECSASNALRFINLCDLNTSELSEWIKELPKLKELLYGESNEEDIRTCDRLSLWIFEQRLSGQHIGNYDTFKHKEFKQMMDCCCLINEECEWIWNVIKQCQLSTNEANFTSLDWIGSSWKRFVLINAVKTEGCIANKEECQRIEIEEIKYHEEVDKNIPIREMNLRKRIDFDEFLWKRNAELLFEKLKKIESHTQTAQSNVEKLQSRLAKKTYAVRLMENEIESRWCAYNAAKQVVE